VLIPPDIHFAKMHAQANRVALEAATFE